MTTLWELQKLIRDGKNLYGEDPGAPYASRIDENHLYMYENISRPATKREHEIGHCKAMQSHCRENGNIPQAVDWALSVLALSERATTYDLSPLCLIFYSKNSGVSEVELQQFQHDAGKDLDRRLIGATVLRCLNTPGIGGTEDKRLPRETIIRLISIFVQTMPDLCKEIRLDTKLDHANQLYTLKVAHEDIASRLVALEEASSAADINILCSLNNTIQKTINNKIVKSILDTSLPIGFTKTKILPLFTLMEELRQAPRASNSRMAHDLKGDLCEEVTDDTLFARSPTAGPRYSPPR